MRLSRVTAVVLLALLGLVIAAAVTYAASTIVSQPIGLTAEPTDIGESLAPRSTTTTTVQRTVTRTTTVQVPTTTPPPQTTFTPSTTPSSTTSGTTTQSSPAGDDDHGHPDSDD